MNTKRTPTMTVVQWNDWEGDGRQYCSLTESPTHFQLEGVVVSSRESPYGAYFNVTMDSDFVAREVEVDYLGLASLHIKRTVDGEWYDCIRQQALHYLKGCVDVDIGVTPSTNTLPIRRLALMTGESRDIDVAYIPLPSEIDGDFLPIPAKERYTCLKQGRTYLYEGIFRGFKAALEVDEHGIVTDYPETFRRVV